MRIREVEAVVLLAAIMGNGFVHGKKDNSGIYDTEFALFGVLIIALFCLGGVYLCCYFTCCHEYLCTASEDVGCCSDARVKETIAEKQNERRIIFLSTRPYCYRTIKYSAGSSKKLFFLRESRTVRCPVTRNRIFWIVDERA